jgi:uncharacterized protein YxjI
MTRSWRVASPASSPGVGDAAAHRDGEALPMGLLRRHGLDGTRYRMREKLVSFGDDAWIETEDGRRVLRVDGKALRVRRTLHLETPSGERLLQAQQRILHLRQTMVLERDGHRVATVHKAMIAPLRDRWYIETEDDGELRVRGNIVDHEYEIERDGEKIAEISKRWFRVRDTYGIEIAPGEDDALILAAAVCIDEMARR